MNPPLKVLFFSVLRDIVGEAEVEVALEAVAASRTGGTGAKPAEVTVGDLLDYCYREYPGLRVWDGKLLLAVDLDYVDRGAVLRGGAEVAMMPPVQGG